jgi:hypothetical protein
LKFHSIKSSLFNGSSYLYKGSLSALKTDSSKPSPSSTSSIKMAMGKVLFLALISLVAMHHTLVEASFASNTKCTWGYNNCQINNDRVKLILNQWSGITNVTNYIYFLFFPIYYKVSLSMFLLMHVFLSCFMSHNCSCKLRVPLMLRM